MSWHHYKVELKCKGQKRTNHSNNLKVFRLFEVILAFCKKFLVYSIQDSCNILLIFYY